MHLSRTVTSGIPTHQVRDVGRAVQMPDDDDVLLTESC